MTTTWRDIADQLTRDDLTHMQRTEAGLYASRDDYASRFIADSQLDRVLLVIARERISERLANDLQADIPLPAAFTDGYRVDGWRFDEHAERFRRGIDGLTHTCGQFELSLTAWQEQDGTVCAAEVFVIANGNLAAQVDAAASRELAAALMNIADEADAWTGPR